MNLKRIFIALFILVVLFSLYNYIQISRYYINKIKLSSNRLGKSIRITQITDFHSNPNINLDNLFKDIKDFNPHIIMLTGDIIDYKTEDFALAERILKASKTITKDVFLVNGNHEFRNKRYSDFQYLLEQNGITVLDNSSQDFEIDGNRIRLFGASFYADESDYSKLFKEISTDDYNILLSHSPNRPIKYLDENIDLILSGHTHGGQVRLPIIGSIISPGQGFLPKYDKGIFQLGNTILYIDSGLGNSVYPIRMFNRVQITNIILDAK